MTELSKNKLKYIRSLERKKVRKEEGVFLAEGPKLVDDLLTAFPCRLLLATSEWMDNNPTAQAQEIYIVNEADLTRASLLQTPQQVLAVFEQPSYELEVNTVARQLSIALDNVQDPGNLGTIIRLADWFGIEHIICSPDTVEAYNPKTVQATMGALARVKLHYTSLPHFLQKLPQSTPVFGTFLNGDNLYEQPLSTQGVLVMGNEGKGISPELEPYITRRLYIPNYPIGRATSESLNVAMATAIACAEFRRQASLS